MTDGRTGLEKLERLLIPLTLWPITQCFRNVLSECSEHSFPLCNARWSSGITNRCPSNYMPYLNLWAEVPWYQSICVSFYLCICLFVNLCISFYIFMGHAGMDRSRLLTPVWSSWITRGNSKRARVGFEPEAFWLSRNPATPFSTPNTHGFRDVSGICPSRATMPAQPSINCQLDSSNGFLTRFPAPPF